MAIKFSQFVLKTLPSELDYIVGYKGTENLQITPDNFLAPYLGAYLPLAGGDMVGPTTHGDTVHSYWGNSNDIDIFHDGANSYIDDRGTGRLSIRASSSMWLRTYANEDYIKMTEGGSVDLYYDNTLMVSTVSEGINLPSNNVLFLDNTNDNNPVYFRNAGGSLATLQIGRGTTPGSNLSMTIDNNGQVGIGVVPTVGLQLGNSVAGETKLAIFNSEGGGEAGLTIQSRTNRAKLRVADNDTSAYVVAEGGISSFGPSADADTTNISVVAGDVGIGTITPSYTLEVDGTATVATAPSYIVANESSGTFKMAIGVQNSPGVAQECFVGTLGNTDFKIMANSAFVGRITTTGRLLVGSGGIPEESIQAGGAIISTASNITSSTAGANRAIMDLTSGGARLGHYRGTTAAGSGSVKLYSDSVLGITLDASQNTQFEGNIELGDSKNANFGASSDLRIYHNATNSNIENFTGDLQIIQNADDKDIIFKCDDGAGGTETYFYLDGGAGGANPFTVFPDNSHLTFGTGYDLRQYHNGTDSYLDNYEGDLIIRNYADDKNINLMNDDGAGGIATYLSLNGAVGFMIAYKLLNFQDNVHATFGNSSDLQIYHNGSNSFIQDTGTGLLVISTNHLQVYNAAVSEFMITAEEDGAVSLYYDSSKKLETTNTGTLTTGQMDIAALNTAPASASGTGTLGEIRYTADYIYVCTATNTWKRSALSTW